jgi:hypothetical protein
MDDQPGLLARSVVGKQTKEKEMKSAIFFSLIAVFCLTPFFAIAQMNVNGPLPVMADVVALISCTPRRTSPAIL